MNSKHERPVTVEEREISTGVLISGLPYQRPVEERDVEYLTRTWDKWIMEPVVVSYRDGKFYLVDGQHRVSALRRMNDGKDTMIRCKLYRGLTYEGEAALCVKLDRSRKKLNAAQTTNALVQSGTDETVTEVNRLLEANSFTWALDKRIPGDYEITASTTVVRAYKLLGASAFGRMLGLMARAWLGAPSSLKAGFISGMALFYKTYETELDDSATVRRLSMIDPEEVLRRGKTDFSTNRPALRYARVLWKKYNSQRGGRKLSYRFNE